MDGFYTFDVATAPDAPTGNYNARVSVGGASFDKTLKVETVMPNRLKIAMDFGTEELGAGSRVAGTLTSAWLHGAPARSLKADVELALSAARTRFDRFDEYSFDDPTRRYDTERQTIFEGTLDETGKARIDAAVAAEGTRPTSATSGSAPRRGTRPAACCSPTRSTVWTWRSWTRTASRPATARSS
jgi:uncharacterized protein YfaS (alpha-2-macroglobulin family)